MPKTEILLQLINKLQTNKSQFERDAKLGNGAIAKAIKAGSNLSDGTIRRILSHFPQVNEDWLTTGKGEMILAEGNKPPAKADGKNYQLLYEEVLEKTNSQLSEAIASIFKLAEGIALSLTEARSDQQYFAQTQIRNQQNLQDGMNLLLAKFFPDI